MLIIPIFLVISDFPKTNGLLQINDTFTGTTAKGIVGHTFSYTHRTESVAGLSDATCDYNNDPTIVMDSTTDLVVGMGVVGTGIPTGATIASIDANGTDFELSVSTTGGAVTNGTLMFTPVHVFYGITGDAFTSSHYVANRAETTEIHDAARVQPHGSNNTMRVLLSPRINWTTLVTDELLAAVTAAAINHEDPNRELKFDCRDVCR